VVRVFTLPVVRVFTLSVVCVLTKHYAVACVCTGDSSCWSCLHELLLSVVCVLTKHYAVACVCKGDSSCWSCLHSFRGLCPHKTLRRCLCLHRRLLLLVMSSRTTPFRGLCPHKTLINSSSYNQSKTFS
jgi:hypothetical protein